MNWIAGVAIAVVITAALIVVHVRRDEDTVIDNFFRLPKCLPAAGRDDAGQQTDVVELVRCSE